MDSVWLRGALFEQGLSKRSVDVYEGAILRAERALGELGTDLGTCTGLDIHRYLEAHVPLSWSSRKLVRSALTRYWDVSGRTDAPVKALRTPPKPRFTCRAIEPDEAERLAKVAYQWDQGGEGVATLFGLCMALRRFEIAQVRWGDMHGHLLEVRGKGGVEATLPLHPVVEDRLRWWRGFEIDDPTDNTVRPGDEYVFEGRGGRYPHAHPATIWTWTKRLAEVAGIEELTTHQLRHTALATANDETGDLRAVQEYARHKDPATTVIYTRVTMERLRRVGGVLGYGLE